MQRNINEHNLPVDQPPGENFFVASIEIHSDLDPCWNSGLNLIGPTWQTLRPLLIQFMTSSHLANRHCTIRIYQGENARTLLQAGIHEELRYQQERQSQPNN